MAHTLNLPQLPVPKQFEAQLVWDVTLTFGGQIGIRLVKKYRTIDDQTIFRFEAANPEYAEEQAVIAWKNYQAVHGGAA